MDISYSSILQWLNGFISSIIDWFVDAFMWPVNKLAQVMSDAGIWAIDGLNSCCSETVTTFTTSWAAFNNFTAGSGSMAYFTNTLNLGLGLKMCFSAYLARFLLRRLPFIG
jgi:hypothetical protein